LLRIWIFQSNVDAPELAAINSISSRRLAASSSDILQTRVAHSELLFLLHIVFR
jgi:hypothetical protein